MNKKPKKVVTGKTAERGVELGGMEWGKTEEEGLEG